MADETTANLGLVKPQVRGSRDTWGEKTNDNWDDVDGIFKSDGTGTSVGLHIGAGKTLRMDGDFAGAGFLGTETLADKAVTYAKIQDVSQNRILGRTTGTGTIEEIILTPAGRAILDDADAAAQRTTLNAASLAANLFTADQVIRSVNDGNAQGPELFLDRASPSPLAGDNLGALVFTGRNTAVPAEEIVFANLRAELQAVANGAESGALVIQTPQVGVARDRVQIGAGMVIQDGAAPGGLADMGVGTVNALAYYVSGQPLAPALRGHIDGLILDHTGTTVTIGAGQATSDDGLAVMSRAAAITKNMATVWAVGNNNGGRDGALANNKWFHVWLIQRSDTGVVDVLLSEDATAPTLPANYDRKRRIGAVLTNTVGGGVTPFEQLGDEFEWKVPVFDVNNVAAGVHTLTVPTGVRVLARITPAHLTVGAQAVTNVSSRYVDDASHSAVGATPLVAPGTLGAGGNNNEWQFGGEMYVRTSTSAGIRTSSAMDVAVITRGWRDLRGRDAS